MNFLLPRFLILLLVFSCLNREMEILVRKGEGCGSELTGQISKLGRELTPLDT